MNEPRQLTVGAWARRSITEPSLGPSMGFLFYEIKPDRTRMKCRFVDDSPCKRHPKKKGSSDAT